MGLTPYGEAFGLSSGYFKYSPFAGLLFIPFTFFSFHIASAIWFFAIAGMVIIAGWRWSKRTFEIFPNTSFLAMLIGGTVLFADHIDREWQLGNVNLLLLLLAYGVFRFFEKKQWAWAGALYAVIILFKPHFVLLGIYFLLKWNWRFAVVSFSTILIALLLPALWLGLSNNFNLLSEWKEAMLMHNVHLYESPNTFYGLIYRYLCSPIGIDYVEWIVPSVLSFIVGIYYFIVRRVREINAEWGNYFLYFILIALIPGLTHTDTEHFIWIWPIALMAWAQAFHLYLMPSAGLERNLGVLSKKWTPIAIMFLASLPFIINTPDLIGKAANHWYEEEGGLGLSYCCFMLLAASAVIGPWKLIPHQQMKHSD
jgi:hypothetical protein